MSSPAHLGIDFGTSHTVAMLRTTAGGVSPLLFDGSPLLPSAVYADTDGTLHTGRDAVYAARVDPARFEPNPKRLVDDGTLLLGEAELGVRAVFAAVLARVQAEAVRVFGTAPRATLTHPAGWGPARRQVLQDAAAEAGFVDPAMVAEPVAAATYFARKGFGEFPQGSGVVVYDFGGGTFDVSVVSRRGEGFTVLAMDGASDLGGIDLDQLLLNHLGAPFADDPLWRRLLAPETPQDRRQYRTLLDDVRSARERLSRHSRVDVVIPLLDRDVHTTRDELEQLARPVLGKAVRLTQAVIREARLPSESVAGVFLVGGTSRMPLAATMLHHATGIEPTVIDQPELVVAHGATLLDFEEVAPISASPVSVPGQPVSAAVPVSPATGPPTSAPPATGQPGSAAPVSGLPIPGPPVPTQLVSTPNPSIPGQPLPVSPVVPLTPAPQPMTPPSGFPQAAPAPYRGSETTVANGAAIQTRTSLKAPGWLVASRVLVWIVVAGMLGGLVWSIVYLTEDSPEVSEYDVSVYSSDDTTDGTTEDIADQVTVYFPPAVGRWAVAPAVMMPLYLLTGAALLMTALQLNRPNPASRRFALAVCYSPLVSGPAAALAEGLTYEPTVTVSMLVAFAPLLPVVIILHRRRAREWFESLRRLDHH